MAVNKPKIPNAYAGLSLFMLLTSGKKVVTTPVTIHWHNEHQISIFGWTI